MFDARGVRACRSAHGTVIWFDAPGDARKHAGGIRLRFRHGLARLGKARLGLALRGRAGRGVVWPGLAWLGKATQGKGRKLRLWRKV